MSTALQASGVRILEHAGTIERFEPCPAGVRLVYSRKGCARACRRDARRRRGGLDREHPRARSGRRRGPDRFARLHQGGFRPPHDRAGHLRRRRRHRAPDGGPRGRARGLPRRHQCNPRRHADALLRKSARSAASQTPNMPLSGSPRQPPARRMTLSLPQSPSTQCRARSSTVAPRGSASSSPSESITASSAGIVGERAVELAQLAAIAVASGMKVEQLALVPFSFPTYANVLGRAAIRAARQLDSRSGWADEGIGMPASPTGLDD